MPVTLVNLLIIATLDWMPRTPKLAVGAGSGKFLTDKTFADARPTNASVDDWTDMQPI